ncbi:MAG: hypothetical protein PHF84_01715 [bacterium]|nr:hypothetical protein [bacterium]
MLKIVFIVISFFSLCSVSEAAAISATPAKVLIENLYIGRTYDLTKVANLPFEVKNTSAGKARLSIRVSRPASSADEPGFESIPDTAWLSLSQSNFILSPHESGSSGMILRIPSDRAWLGKKFEVDILTTGHEESAVRRAFDLEVELLSKIFFTVADTEAPEHIPDMKVNLQFSVTPVSITLSNVAPAMNIDLEKAGFILNVENLNNEEYSYSVRSILPSEALVPLPYGYRAGQESGVLRFSATNVTAGPRSSQKIKMFLDLPDSLNEKESGLLFVASLQVVNKGVRGTKLVKIYVKTRKKKEGSHENP